MEKHLPRTAAVHDISGYGKCALTTAIPVLSACGVEVCPVPTAVLSTNTNFPGFTLLDTTEEMTRFADHWAAIGMTFDALYSGFLGSEKQIACIERLHAAFSPSFTVIDPVCGDEGVVYKTYTPAMCESLKRLARIADVLVPNLTEACVLTGAAYAQHGRDTASVRRTAEALRAMGARSVVLTGIERGDTLYNCILEDGQYTELPVSLLPFRMHGTGDLFASVMTGGLLTGHTLTESVESAARFVRYTMQESRAYQGYPHRGVCFEPYLPMLAGGLCTH